MIIASPADAQKRADARGLLPESSRPLVRDFDPTLQFNHRRVAGGRLDSDSGVWRAAYRIRATTPVLASPELTARAWMEANADRFGWTTGEDLVLTEEVNTSYSTHLTFTQTYRGVPVHRRAVKVNLGPEGRPTMVLSTYAPHVRDARSLNVTPAVSQDQARSLAQAHVSESGASSSEPELVVHPLAVPVLAWRVIAWPENTPGEWEVLLDAQSGAVIHLLDRVMWHKPGQIMHIDDSAYSHGHAHANDVVAIGRVDGIGQVWIPDPLTSAGVSYGGDYVDNNDQNSNALNDERQQVTLLDIELGSDSKYRLRGPHVSIDGSAGGYSYNTPAEDNADDFQYLRANQHFEAVLVYYHVDLVQRYIRSLDIGRPIQGGSIRANPHGLGPQDNASYSPAQNTIQFGDGGIDDAEDAEVVVHEYGHAVLESSSANLFSGEGAALHEGWSDYWATSFTRGLMDASQVQGQDWQQVFDWDGNETWSGRRLGSTATYPSGFTCVGGNPTCNIYADGLIWATSLMQIYDAIGKEKVDQLNLISHGYLSPGVTFADAAEALLQADQDRYQGAHSADMRTILNDRGYVDCGQVAPTLGHQSANFANDDGSPHVVELTSMSCADDLVSHTVQYALDDDPRTAAAMQRVDDNTYSYAIALPPGAETIRYYFEVDQTNGDTTRLPANAPQEVFTVPITEDFTAPEITHAYLTHVTQTAWPPTIEATITDDVGVRESWVEFQVVYADSSRDPVQKFALVETGDRYTGQFPPMNLPIKTRIDYRIWANDLTNYRNEGALPPADVRPFSIYMIEPGILASYTADGDPLLPADGQWRRVRPAFGLEASRSGEFAWMTADGEPYTDQASISMLKIPTIDLTYYAGVWLELWHWHDLEHSGITDPVSNTGGTAFDGGNVKASTDGGLTWSVLHPEGGYGATLDAGNPLNGEPAFAGYSYGWRRVLFPLPQVPSLMVRIESGTDTGNTHSSAHDFAGWAIDGIRILEERPREDDAPVVHTTFEPLVHIPHGSAAPGVHLVASDNTGIESVLAAYTFVPQVGASTSGTVRLAMNTADVTRFAGDFPISEALQLGDQVRYRFRVRDFDQNTAYVPAQGEPELVIEAATIEQLPALARANVTGVWRQSGNGGFQTGGDEHSQVSSIVLAPVALPANASRISLRMTHEAMLDQARGNVKASVNDGAQWEVIDPMGGYDETYTPGASVPMHGEAVFAGNRDETAIFDLTGYAGENIWLRIDLGSVDRLGSGEAWTIHTATVLSAATEPTLEHATELVLYGNYPDPVAGRTTISYALPEPMPVRVELFNVLGQRMMVLVDREQAGGLHTLQLDLGAMAGGLYFLRVNAGSKAMMEPIIVTR